MNFENWNDPNAKVEDIEICDYKLFLWRIK